MENWRELIYEEDGKTSRKELQTDLLVAVKDCRMLIERLKTPALKVAAIRKLKKIWDKYGLTNIELKGDAGKLVIWKEITSSHKTIKIQNKKTIEKMKKVRNKVKRSLFDLNQKQKRMAGDYAKQRAPQRITQHVAIKTIEFGISVGKAAGKTMIKAGGLALVIPTLVIGYLDYKKARKDGLKSGYAVGSALWKAIPGVDFMELLNVMRDDKQDQQTINDLLKDLQNNPSPFKKSALGIRKGKNLKKPLISIEALEGAIEAIMALMRTLFKAQNAERKIIRKVNINLNRINGKIKKKKTSSSVPKSASVITKKAKPKIVQKPPEMQNQLDCDSPKDVKESNICYEKSWINYNHEKYEIKNITVGQVFRRDDSRKLFKLVSRGFNRWRSIITGMIYEFPLD